MNAPAPLKIMMVIGTRPEAIKMAPVVHELARQGPMVSTFVCATGQHRELLSQTLALFDVRPDRNLDVMVHDQTLSGLTASLYERLDPLVRDERPDWLLVQGDTTTAMVGATVGFYRGVRVGHVEAGLRTGDLRQPFPEEFNRRVADLCADLCFAPTDGARANLLQEGIPPARIHVTGNTIVEAVAAIAARPYVETTGPLVRVPRAPRWVLVTMHRRENFGEGLERICEAVGRLVNAFGDSVHVILPVHPNPQAGQAVSRLLALPNCSVVAPLDYHDLVHVLQRAALVLTDSGGIQEEAPTFGVPVLVLREKTERPEGVQSGAAQTVGTDPDTIVAEASKILRSTARHTPMPNPYGDGHAARRIADLLCDRHFGARPSA
jgi:UDP-N-acetylglucosamine 2-epimerase (non-hydrolysing)